MMVRTRKVTYLDAHTGIEHTVSVGAPSLYEAVGQTLRIFRRQPWCDQDLRRSAASLMVRITSPEIEHRVKISALSVGCCRLELDRDES
jgi:hypothetical protein